MPISKGDLTRARILKNAKKIIAKQGLTAGTFERIAKASLVKQPTVFYHFKDKNELIRALIEDGIQNSHRIVAEGTARARNPLERLHLHFELTLKWAMEFRDESSLLGLLYYLGSFDKNFAALYSEIRDRARARIREILYEMEVKDVENTSRILHDALLGSIVNTLATGASAAEKGSLKARWRALIQRAVISSTASE